MAGMRGGSFAIKGLSRNSGRSTTSASTVVISTLPCNAAKDFRYVGKPVILLGLSRGETHHFAPAFLP